MTPHRTKPTSTSTAPLPPMPPPIRLQSGYNPSTASSPAQSPLPISSPYISPLSSPNDAISASASPERTRSDTLAPPTFSRPRVSRSASPLARAREPLLPDLESRRTSESERGQVPMIFNGHDDQNLNTYDPRPVSTVSSIYSSRSSLAEGSVSNFSRPLSRMTSSDSTTLPIRAATAGPLAREAEACSHPGSRRVSKGPPPPIYVPPPVPQVPSHYQAREPKRPSLESAASSESMPAKGTQTTKRNSIVSEGYADSRYSQDSVEGMKPIVDEAQAIRKTLLATRSIKSQPVQSAQGQREKKEKKMSRFLKRRTQVESEAASKTKGMKEGDKRGGSAKARSTVEKPLISPPTLVHSATTSALPQLRNRKSLGAPIEVGEGGRQRPAYVGNMEAAVTDASAMRAGESKMGAAELSHDTSDISRETAKERRLPREGESHTDKKETRPPKLEKKKTFPFANKTHRQPEDVASLESSGFFKRAPLPPVKYTRLPVLAVSGHDLEKANEEHGGKGVRVSLDIAPMIWWEARRRTLRMSLAARRKSKGIDGHAGGGGALENEETVGTAVSDTATKKSMESSRSSVIRFSWLPGEENLSHLKSPLPIMRSPSTSSSKSPGASMKSPGQSSLKTVIEEIDEKDRTVNEASDKPDDLSNLAKKAAKIVSDPKPAPTPTACNDTGISKVVRKEIALEDAEGDQDLGTTEQGITDQSSESVPSDKLTATSRIENVKDPDLTQVLESLAQEDSTSPVEVYDELSEEQAEEVELKSLSSSRFSQAIQKLTEALSRFPKDEGGDSDVEKELQQADGCSDNVQTRNRTSWMLNTGAPSPHDVKILAAVPCKGSVTEDVCLSDEHEVGAEADAKMELRILSAYELPEQSQVLAVIAEEEENQENTSADQVVNSEVQVSTNSWPMMLASPGLPSLRMIGLADVEEDMSDTGSEESGPAVSSLFSGGTGDTDFNDTPAQKIAQMAEQSMVPACRTDGIAYNEGAQVPPLGVNPEEKQTLDADGVAQVPYIPGPIKLTQPGDMFNRGSIAGMDIWSDKEESEIGWQRSEQALLDGMLEFFSKMVNTSETSAGMVCGEYDEDLTFLAAPILDSAFLNQHTIENVFAEATDPSKPPPLPPLPANLSVLSPGTLSSPGAELISSPASLKSIRSQAGSLGSPSRSSSSKRQKPVAVHSPGIGTLIMKRGLF